MDSKAIKKLPKDVSIVGVWLAVVLLASACGPPNARQLGQACQASNDTQSAECAGYWGKGQQHQSATLTAKDNPPAAGLGSTGTQGPIGTRGPIGPGGAQSRRNGW
jgi:hypothetical protein